MDKIKFPVRWGILGCGAVTEIKSGPAYQKTDGFQITAVMRRNESLAKDYAKRHNIETYYSDADSLIKDENIDAIYVATPPDTHKLYGVKVAEAGKACCIEKPLAPNYSDSLEIYEAFKKADVPLFVAYYRRSLPRFNRIKHLIDDGEIGKIRHVSWHLNKAANQIDLSGEYNWRTDKKIARGGYFDDLASHGLDLFSYLFGDFKTVKGHGANQQGLYSAFDNITACWIHRNGISGVGSWNFGGYSRKDQVVIYGNKGEISFSVFDESPIHIQTENNQDDIFVDNPENIQFYHVRNIKNQLLSGTAHPSNGRTALHTSWVMDEILGEN